MTEKKIITLKFICPWPKCGHEFEWTGKLPTSITCPRCGNGIETRRGK